MEDKSLPGEEPLGVIEFGRFSYFLCYFQVIDFFNKYVNLAIIFLPMALLPATFCPLKGSAHKVFTQDEAASLQ